MDTKLKQSLVEYLNTKEPKTAFQYQAVIKEYISKMKIKKLSDITEQSLFNFKKIISTYKNHKGELKQSSSNTIYKKTVTLRNYLNHLKRQNLISKNIVSPEPPFVSSKIPTLLTQQQCLALLAAPNRTQFTGHRDYLLIKTMLLLGCRLSEIQSLRFNNFVKKYSFVVLEIVGKGNRHREIRLPTDYYQEIKSYKEKYWKNNPEDSLVFQSNPKNTNSFKSGKLSATSIKYLLNKYRIKAGIDRHIHPHLLRHQNLSMLAMSGRTSREIMAVSGHKSISTTEIYLHNIEGLTKDIVGSNILFQKNKVF